MQFDFARIKKPIMCDEIGSAMETATKFAILPQQMMVGEIKVLENGHIMLGSQKEDLKITHHGMKSFCGKVLGIPLGFADTIPKELLLHNIKRLSVERKEMNVQVLLRDNGDVASIVKEPYSEAPIVEVLGLFADRDKKSVKYIEVGEVVTTIAFTFQEMFSMGFNAKDTFYAGCFVHTSPLKVLGLAMSSGLYRTQCENSFVMPFFGKIKANYQNKVETRLLRFHEQVSSLLDTRLPARLEQVFSKSSKGVLFEHQWAGVWSSLARIRGEVEADELMKTELESRNVLLDNAKEFLREKKEAKLLGTAPPDAVMTTTIAYDVANAVTLYAKDLQEQERIQLEKFGGDILQKFVLNMN